MASLCLSTILSNFYSNAVKNKVTRIYQKWEPMYNIPRMMKTIYCSLWSLDCLARSITFEQKGWNVPRKFDPAEQTKRKQKCESGTQSRIWQTAGFRFIYSHERISFTEINVKISSNNRFSRHCTVDKATLSSIRALPRAWNHFLTSHISHVSMILWKDKKVTTTFWG